MTIPRIGDKIIRTNSAPKQPDNTEQSVSPQPFDDNTQDVSKDIQDEQKEYSLKAFKRDFHDIFRDKVIPVLGQFEPIRKKTLTRALIFSGLLVVPGAILVIMLLMKGERPDFGIFLITIGWAIYAAHKKFFERKLKRKVMSTLMKAVPGFRWIDIKAQLTFWEHIFPSAMAIGKIHSRVPINVEEIDQSMIFPRSDDCTESFDDCFEGTYRDVDVKIAECDYKIHHNKSTTTIFDGVLIRFKMNKRFEGMTILRPKKHVQYSYINDLKEENLQQVELEDIEINKMYNIYSTDQIEARYLLTTSFMERFQHITTAFNSKVSYCAFYDQYVYIAPYSTKDLFSLGSLVKPVYDESQFIRMFEEFASLLALVDHFKLDKKLGL